MPKKETKQRKKQKNTPTYKNNLFLKYPIHSLVIISFIVKLTLHEIQIYIF